MTVGVTPPLVAAPTDTATPETAPAARAYTELPVHEKAGSYQQRSLVKKILWGRAPLDENKAKFRQYFTKFIIPKMTQSSEWADQAKHRKELFKKYIRSAKSQKAHDEIVRTYCLYMQALAQVPRVDSQGRFIYREQFHFHPAVRYSAMIILGQLNQKEVIKIGSKKRAAEPWIAALDPMRIALRDPKQIDAVRVAALIGIRRHVESKLPKASLELIQKDMLMIFHAKPPHARSVEGHIWMQRQAIEILGEMRSTLSNPEVANLIAKIVADRNAPMTLRCAAAKAQGQWAPKEWGGNPAIAIGHLGLLASDICRQEANWLHQQIEESKKECLAGMRGASPDIGGFADDTDPEAGTPQSPAEAHALRLARRRLKYRLDCLRQGLVGPKGKGGIKVLAKKSAFQAQRQTFVTIYKSIGTLMEELDDSAMTAETFQTKAKDAANVLKRASGQLLPKKPKPAKKPPVKEELGP